MEETDLLRLFLRQSVLFELPPERHPVNAQDLRGKRFVAADFAQHPLDIRFLLFVEGRNFAFLLPERLDAQVPQVLGQVAGFDAAAVGERHAALTGLPINWVGTYMHVAERFIRHCEVEAKYVPRKN